MSENGYKRYRKSAEEREITLLEIYLKEYEKLKEEQLKRITFRDVTIPLSMFAAIGSIATAVSNNTLLGYYSLLMFPCVCFVLGWIYVVNDEKVSAIGKYVRTNLKKRVLELSRSIPGEPLFEWEIFHRGDMRRESRKLIQLLVDEITFFFSGLGALGTFHFLVPSPTWSLITWLLWLVDLSLLCLIAYWIDIYADLTSSKSPESSSKPPA